MVDIKKIKEQESLLGEKDAEIEALRKKIEEMSAQYTAEKEQHKEVRSFKSEDVSEFKTRKQYIDIDMKEMGWKFKGAEADVQEEYPLTAWRVWSDKRDIVIMFCLERMAALWRWWKRSVPARIRTLAGNRLCCMRTV